MRFLIGSATASLLLAGAVIASGSPAYAGDDIFFNHAAGTMSASPTTETQAPVRTQPYMQIEPRDAKVTASKEGVEGDNIYYDHAEGTMSGNPVDSGPSASDQSGQYTASYHQYMKMDPRDAKAVTRQSADDSNIYFNHAQGTMSGN